MTSTREKEIWKTYLKYPWIEASNLGRVRTNDRIVTRSDGIKFHIKGKVLKQHLNPCGYMYVTFSVNEKTVSLSVHRIVATCFIPNPDNLPEVNHRDNDRTNNSVSNLEWCTRQYNQDYKKNFGTSAAEVSGRQVFAVNLKTSKVLRFETLSEAACQLGINVQNISGVVRGKLIQTGGYWFTEDKSEITEEKIREIKDKMVFIRGVIVVKPKTSEVFWFESQHEAARQIGASVGNVNSVLKGKQNKTKSCWLTYTDENVIENVREKFGDEMANKVKKLIKKKTERVIL